MGCNLNGESSCRYNFFTLLQLSSKKKKTLLKPSFPYLIKSKLSLLCSNNNHNRNNNNNDNNAFSTTHSPVSMLVFDLWENMQTPQTGPWSPGYHYHHYMFQSEVRDAVKDRK